MKVSMDKKRLLAGHTGINLIVKPDTVYIYSENTDSPYVYHYKDLLKIK